MMTPHRLAPLGLGLVLLAGTTFAACSADETSSTSVAAASSTSATGAGGAGGTGGTGGAGGVGGAPVAPSDFCVAEGLPSVAFDAVGPYGKKRHQLAEDFEVPLVDGTTFRLSERFSGCESYVFLTSARRNSDLDSTSLWKRDIDQLTKKSPRNVHYFFVANRMAADAQTELDELAPRLEAALAKLEPAEAEHFRARLHLVAKHSSELDGWLGSMLSTGEGRAGFAIDRRQEIRFLGNFADVKRFKSALQNAGKWPWESNLSYASYEARLYNYEAKRAAALAADGATVVSAWKDEVLKYVVEKEVDLPDAAAMAGFDTLTIDNVMDCPDPDKGEFGNCGAWDYLAHLYLLDEDGVTWRELARFITTYHREGHYTVDATPMLAFLKKGGKRKLRYTISPEWNQQAYLSRVDFRFSNQKKGYRPTTAHPLWGGGAFNSMYASTYTPLELDIPATAKRVELWALITGHGGATKNCAEFCDHQHEFTVNGNVHLKAHPESTKQDGCIAEVDDGMVPNQGGTWWFGRGGWCPGQQVKPYVVDVTAEVPAGGKATVSYRGLLSGATPPDNAGDIVMSSHLVVYE
ncbi:MAG: hypothetical protein FJ095_20315 [Deltaproteobacteria bacterium]|nr:hypothetical protein [Deltaproteobacteria bacterium]